MYSCFVQSFDLLLVEAWIVSLYYAGKVVVRSFAFVKVIVGCVIVV